MSRSLTSPLGLRAASAKIWLKIFPAGRRRPKATPRAPLRLWLANNPSEQKPLTSASPLGTLQAMRGGFRTGAAVRAVQATRKDLLLETLALRHQLSVLARSHRRFRPTDRLLVLLLRWLWPQWREGLVLVQAATVDRWYREGVRRCRHRRAGRPGRPRIDSSCRDLIQRMAAENCLWGAPRIHGELLKLGFAISERTVSRYLRGRPPARSQTWRTFFANHLGGPTLPSPVMFTDARGDDVVGSRDVSSRPTQLSTNAFGVSTHWAIFDQGRSLEPTFLGKRLRHDHLHDRTGAGKKTGRDPPPHPLHLPRRPATGSFRLCLQYLCDRWHRDAILPRGFTIGSSESPSCAIESPTRSEANYSPAT